MTTLEQCVMWVFIILLAVAYRFLCSDLIPRGLAMPEKKSPLVSIGTARKNIAKEHIARVKKLTLNNKSVRILKDSVGSKVPYAECYFLIGTHYVIQRCEVGSYYLVFNGRVIAFSDIDDMSYLIALVRAKSIEKL